MTDILLGKLSSGRKWEGSQTESDFKEAVKQKVSSAIFSWYIPNAV